MGAACIGLLASAAKADQVVEVPNPSFESGLVPVDDPAESERRKPGAPAGWQLIGDRGAWLQGESASGHRSVAVTGDGEASSYWRSEALSLEPRTTYRLSFVARRLSGEGGTPISGPVFCNRDLESIGESWQTYTSVFFTPDSLGADFSRLRFGQWRLAGTVAFDDISLRQVTPLYRNHQGGLALGEGEMIAGNSYRFRAPQRSISRNHSRPLVRHQCDFNTYRWVFKSGSEVVYRHRVSGRRQITAAVTVEVSYHVGGELLVEISTDGSAWWTAGIVGGVDVATFDLPQSLLPAESVWVRLSWRSRHRPGVDSDPGSLQISAYAYDAELDGDPVSLAGSTHFIAAMQEPSPAVVAVASVGDPLPGVPTAVQLRVDNSASRVFTATGTVTVEERSPPFRSAISRLNVEILPGGQRIILPYSFTFTGDLALEVRLEGEGESQGEKLAFRGETDLMAPAYFATTYGQRLSGGDEDMAVVWWASSGWKVPPMRPVPQAEGKAILISAARAEAEAAQLVLRPVRPLSGLHVRAGELVGPGGARIPAAAVEILKVQYVDVDRPTDTAGAGAGRWPDPLLPLPASLDLDAGQNQPLWIRVTVPAEAEAGTFVGHIHLEAAGYEHSVPLRVEVFDFRLPDRMTCQTAFGFSPENVWRYHRLSTEGERRAVLNKYWRSFSAHHISPYDPAPLDPLRVTWPDSADLADGVDFALDFEWENWDAAMTRAIDAYHFNSFRLAIPGMGGGTFHTRYEPELAGYGEDSDQYSILFNAYCRAMQGHLRQRGWLDEAFVYWFDEPDPKDYGFVMNGFARLAAAAPLLTRMLTEQPEVELEGGPNLWCPVSYSFDQESALERSRQGERFWWYVCTVPKAPYCTLFIDHPATELRVWLWQTWARGIGGILVWATNYWTSNTAYPDGLQDPYGDTMSWSSEYSAPAGARRPWGNGDGRFLYPPLEAVRGSEDTPVMDGPVESIRWEMLRDGIEDYEYLAMLRRLLELKGERLSSLEAESYARLLDVPDSVTRSLRSFTEDPAPIEAHRRRLAVAIATLSRL
jgi:hypothetical protein